MTDEDKIEMFRMRLNRVPVNDIAKKYGISRQRVMKILESEIHDRRKPKNVKYNKLWEKVIEKYGSYKEFYRKTGIYDIGKIINGTAKDLRVEKLCKIFNMSYNDLFEVNDE